MTRLVLTALAATLIATASNANIPSVQMPSLWFPAEADVTFSTKSGPVTPAPIAPKK